MTYSAEGYGGMSRNMHTFVQDHIVRGTWQYRERPVLLNSWEASYFDISESKLTRLAKAAKDLGIELFVKDDGWFGKRDDDTSSLGDWEPNPKKLPNGIEGIAKKITDLGIGFGLWVEPEMVNEDSDLFRTHPDWALTDDYRILIREYLLCQMGHEPELYGCIFRQFICRTAGGSITPLHDRLIPDHGDSDKALPGYLI